jgi:signal transduction histidine kinase/phage shock protein PspC (stress-responsive transcriptional regulator)
MTPGARAASPAPSGPARPASAAGSALVSTLVSTRVRPPGGRLRLPDHPVRPRQGRLVAGVCAGLERAVGWNAWIFRAVLVFALTPAAYVGLWLVMPPDGRDGRPGGGRLRDALAWVLLLGLGVAVAALAARELIRAGLPGVVAVGLGALAGAAVPVLPWSPLLAWRVLTVVEVFVVVAGVWYGRRVFPLWPLPLAGLPVLALLLVLLAGRYPRPVALCAGAATFVLGAVAALLPTPDAALLPVAGALVVGLLLVGDSLRRRRVADRRVAEQLAGAERDRVRTAVLEERARIARELHDVLAHHLTLIAVQAEAVPHKVPELPEPLHTSVRAIRDAAREALTGTRTILGLLRTDDADGAGPTRAPAPGLADLDELVGRVRRAGTDVEVTVHGDPGPLPLAVDVAAYRIVQEALSNTARHSPGAAARVTIGHRSGALTVEITDGGGPVGHPEPGHGLIGMRERVAALGGRFRAGPGDAGGFTVSAELPVPTGPAEQ